MQGHEAAGGANRAIAASGTRVSEAANRKARGNSAAAAMIPACPGRHRPK